MIFKASFSYLPLTLSIYVPSILLFPRAFLTRPRSPGNSNEWKLFFILAQFFFFVLMQMNGRKIFKTTSKILLYMLRTEKLIIVDAENSIRYVFFLRRFEPLPKCRWNMTKKYFHLHLTFLDHFSPKWISSNHSLHKNISICNFAPLTFSMRSWRII